ncbi:MAG TPA: transposase [Thermoanaerobaculia bacterium]|nr:transposase [Thermoanaerobaculia bacterium]
MRHDNLIPFNQTAVYRSRGRLPHWFMDGAIYTVTFRLKDSLPRQIARLLVEERARIIAGARNASERAALDHAFVRQFDAYLDAGHGSCILREHGEIMAETLIRRDGVDYVLHAWCVMPNHVHVMFSVEHGENLPWIIKAWKGTAAHAIRRGSIWQREYFDRIVRSTIEYERESAYIRRNPEKAGLRSWRWVG